MNLRTLNFLWVALSVTACGSGGNSPAPAGVTITEPERGSGMDAVTQTYGPLSVNTGQFDIESPNKPWSSWWFPVTETYLFKGTNGQPGPLQKYDSYVSAVKYKEAGSASFEETKLYDPSAADWEGLCNAWSAASLLEPEPTTVKTVGGITFGIGDQKALLVKSYEIVDGLKQFGQRFNGERGDDFMDIYPDQFHKFMQHELFENHRSFILDKDPGIAVWNTPVFRASVQITPDAKDPTVRHVDTWLFGASPFVDNYDFVGTLAVAFEYTYDLYGTARPDGTFDVVYGVWTGKSLDAHPDFVTQLPEKKTTHWSKNTKLDYAIVQEILSGKAVPAPMPGH